MADQGVRNRAGTPFGLFPFAPDPCRATACVRRSRAPQLRRSARAFSPSGTHLSGGRNASNPVLALQRAGRGHTGSWRTVDRQGGTGAHRRRRGLRRTHPGKVVRKGRHGEGSRRSRLRVRARRQRRDHGCHLWRDLQLLWLAHSRRSGAPNRRHVSQRELGDQDLVEEG